MAKLISKHTPVICSFITPYESTREDLEIPSRRLSDGACLDLPRGVRGAGRQGALRQGPDRRDLELLQAFQTTSDHPNCATLTLNSSGREGRA